MSDYKFDSRLERAATLPAHYYIDPAVLQSEQRSVVHFFPALWNRRHATTFTSSVECQPAARHGGV